MLDLSLAKQIKEVFEIVLNMGAGEIKQVKDETEGLLGHLRESLVSLWDVTKETRKLSDEDFKTGFPKVYDYFKIFYYSPENIQKARTHCTDLERDVNRITFKLAEFFRTDVGKWKQVKEAIKNTLNADRNFIGSYEDNMKILNQRLKGINVLLAQGKDADALDAYRALRIDLAGDLDALNAFIETMRQADVHVRRLVS